MRSAALLPALAFVAGTGIGASAGGPAASVVPPLVLVLGLLAGVSLRPMSGLHPALLASLTCAAGTCHGAAARDAALHPPLRAVLAAAFGGFAIDAAGTAGAHDPVLTRAVLVDDAVDGGEFVSLRVQVRSVRVGHRWQQAGGPAIVTVNGAVGRERIARWRAGRGIEAPVTFRRAARYLNDGVPDFETDAALGGVALFGSVKSGLLVEVVHPGTGVQELAADARVFVREAVTRWVAPHGEVAAAIVTAVLIGDRSGLPADIRERLQAAGTYHVIAISGGNIAILAVLVVSVLTAAGVHHRLVAALAMAALLSYAQVVSAGPSVWRATFMAVLYLAARLFDHRPAPWHTVALAAAAIAVVQPLDVRDAGFLLTFGATAGLLAAGRLRQAGTSRRPVAAWVGGAVIASLAAEVMVLPVSASAFSRVTAAGLVLNLVAVPAMTVVQIAGMAVVAAAHLPSLAAAAGAAGAMAATVLVESARFVDVVPVLARRVPPPAIWVVCVYYVGLAAGWWWRWRPGRAAAVLVLALAAASIVSGTNPLAPAARVDGVRLTMFDVGQGESMLLEWAGGEPVVVDAGGSPFGGGASAIGERVLAPALWSRGVRRIGALLVTHADPDHLGGAAALVSDFAPRELWWGVQVAPHQPSRAVIDAAARAGIPLQWRRAGESLTPGPVRIRVLSPPEPDWDRRRVRNDDSVVLEVLYGDVALLLTGDVSAAVERAIAPQLTAAPVRVLKIAHHGSRTSTSPELLEAWRPQVALISCGRGNTFGHPAADVVARLETIGARVYRTDRDGEITLETDGRRVRLTTFLDRKR